MPLFPTWNVLTMLDDIYSSESTCLAGSIHPLAGKTIAMYILKPCSPLFLTIVATPRGYNYDHLESIFCIGNSGDARRGGFAANVS